MNKQAGGSDIDEKMVACTQRNLDWLSDNFSTPQPEGVQTADARSLRLPENVSSIVTEGYLGPIMYNQPAKAEADRLAEESDSLLRATLDNLHPQLAPKARLCLAAPAWKVDQQNVTPSVVDDHSISGYNRVSLKDISTYDLLYRRDSQYVGRQLILLERN